MDSEKPVRLARAVNLVLGLWSSLQNRFAGFKIVITAKITFQQESVLWINLMGG